MLFHPCIIVPIYNHPQIAFLIKRLIPYHLPLIFVDDGCDDICAHLLNRLAQDHDQLTLIRHESNQGKGAAIITALNAAHQNDFSHALQIDADGQHNTDDISTFLSLSRQNPTALVSGQPIYDNIPRSKYFLRYITHIFVWLETFSLSIKDSMCGLRVYPISSTINLIRSRQMGRRMSFDIEIMVRLYWENVPILFLPTRVTYPEDGLSHFRMWHDNLLISYMHTKLFFGALLKIPLLVIRKFQ